MSDLRVKLGKQPPRHDDRTLRLARYVDLSTLPTPPASTDRAKSSGVTFGMFGNASCGDCTFAGRGNLRRLWAACTSRPQPVTDADVVDAYARFTGYDPMTRAGDNGAVELDVLNDWRKVPFAGETIDGYTAVDIRDDDMTRVAIWVADGMYGGYALPASAQAQLRAGEPFDVTTGSDAYPGSWGGHCMVEVDYDDTYVYLATWGQVVPATWAWVRAYRDEGYAVLSSLDQIAADGRTRDGFDLEHLQADLAAL